MKFGIQMYGAGRALKEKKEAFWAEAAGMGYRWIEPCLGQEPSAGVWTVEELEEYMPVMQAYGLSVVSCHILSGALDGWAPRLKELTGKYGIRQYVISCPEPIDGAYQAKQLEDCRELARQLSGFGAQLLAHNGMEVSCRKMAGKSAYEQFLESCAEEVGAQADVGWLLYGGEDPEAFLWRNKGRIRSLHYKDMKLEEGGYAEAPVGQGALDMAACFQFARAMEIPQFIDQDSSQDFLRDLREAGKKLSGLTGHRERTKSRLCILDVETGELEELHKYDKVVEAPNWTKDGGSLVFNSEGLIYRFDIATGQERVIDSGACNNCNNDHVLSPDQKEIVVSHSEEGWQSKAYILPAEGGSPRCVTDKSPSFVHGWSPDGKELAYCAFRDYGKGQEVDIYTISVLGGGEKRLTAGAGFNDGPEYAPDGKSIWFNSTRTGRMQVFRMGADGSGPVQMTDDDRNNWFPHVSPDGEKVVYISYSGTGLESEEHLPNMQVELWRMDSDGGNRRKVLEFFGGQGSLNVNSWAPDSRRLAMVVYELEHK